MVESVWKKERKIPFKVMGSASFGFLRRLIELFNLSQFFKTDKDVRNLSTLRIHQCSDLKSCFEKYSYERWALTEPAVIRQLALCIKNVASASRYFPVVAEFTL